MAELYLVTAGACLIASFQWFVWAFTVRQSAYQWTIASMALAFSGIQASSYFLFSTTDLETASLAIKLLTGFALIAFPLFVGLVSQVARLPRPHKVARSFAAATVFLIALNTLTPYGIPFEQVAAVMRSDLVEGTPRLQGHVSALSILLPLYYVAGFGWLGWCIFVVRKMIKRVSIWLLISFLVTMVMAYLWDTAIAIGIWEGFSLGGLPFVVLILLISLRESQYLKAALDSRDNISRHLKAERRNLRKLDADFRALAFKDQVTGLPNRAYFLDYLEQFLISDLAEDYLYLFFISVDEFKSINMFYGYTVGDELLRQVGERLEQSPYSNEMTARVSDDTFAVLLELPEALPEGFHLGDGNSWQEAAGIDDPYNILGSPLHVSFSVGVVPIDNKNKKARADDYLLKAEVALHRSQNNKEISLIVYDEQLRHELEKESLLAQGLKTAISNNELSLMFQPQFDCDDQLLGAEVLLRWHHPDYGFVSPELFVPLAERSGLIRQIDGWVLDQSLRQMRQWLEKGLAIPRIAINISAITLYAKETVGLIADALKKHQIDPEIVELEVTETALVQDLETCIKVLQGLRQLGVRIAIDDFGTGYSSLSYLGSLPADTLKIDKVFTQQVMHFQGRKLVGMIINIGRALRMDVLAEGVETRQQRDELSDLYCSQYQGYWFCKPLNAEGFAGFLSERSQQTESLEPGPVVISKD